MKNIYLLTALTLMIKMKDTRKSEVILMNLIAIDIGGTTIKIATWINQKLKMAVLILKII